MANPANSLRCNFIMRGVVVPAGEHEVQFRFQPGLGLLYVSLTAIACGLVLMAQLVERIDAEERVASGVKGAVPAGGYPGRGG